MKHYLLFIALLWALCQPLAAAAAAAPVAKPNILLILADDLGWSDLGCYGGEIQTPNLDALARGGVRFTQFYNSARCCPTRASLLTGLYPHQAGVGSMTSDSGPEHPGFRGTLQPNTVTLAEVLRDAGYRTYMVGKWHLRNDRTDLKPTDRGFDEFYGMLGGYNSCWDEHPFYTRWPVGRTPRAYTSAKDGQPGTFYSTDAFADYALDFLGDARQAGKPFFLYLAFNAPHFPLHAPEADIAKYEALYFAKGWDAIRDERLARQKELGLVPKDVALTPRSPVVPKSHAKPSPYAGKDNPAWNSLPEDRRRDLARRMAVYAAMVYRLDVAVGRVLADLRQHGQLDNTLILFLSDNGACWEWDPLGFDGTSGSKNVLHTGDDLKTVGGPASYMSYGSGWANAGNTPWRLYKHFSHEGGIRAPLIVHWPAGVPARGELRVQVGHIIDVMPTLLAVSGANYPAERNGVKIQSMEGRSLLPALANQAIPTYDQRRTAVLRGSKLSLYEGGIREPLLVWWPGRTPAARTNDHTVFTALDLLPTLCAIAGVAIPADVARQLDGEDLNAALTGGQPTRTRPLFWEYGRNPNSFAYPKEPYHRSPNLAVREGDWKLLINADGTGAELYDLATDPKEQKNLAGTQTEIVQRLTKLVLNWRKTLR